MKNNDIKNDNNVNGIVTRLLTEADKRDKRIYYYLVSLSFIIILLSLLISILLKDKMTFNDKLNLDLYIFTPPVLVSLFFIIISFNGNSKFGSQLLDKLILLNWRKKRTRKDSDIVYTFIKFLNTFIYYLLIISGFLYLYITVPFSDPKKVFLFSIAGTIVIYGSLLIIILYLIILPQIISRKTKTEEYKYFYWMHFIKGAFVNNTLSVFCVLLYIIISSIIVLFTIKVTTKEFNKENLGLVIALLGLWLSAVLIIAQTFMNAYTQIYKTYENYASHILRERIIYEGNFYYNLIGLGSLGRIICGSLLYQIIMQYEKEKNKPLLLFEFIVDRDLNIRIVPRKLIVIEKDQSLFEEIHLDPDSGLTYGFANGKEMLSLDKYLKIDVDKLDNLAVFCLNGDGGHLPALNLADYEKNNVIINTSSDHDMGLKLKMIIEKEFSADNKLPVVISTVEDSATESFLERKTESKEYSKDDMLFYPLHANHIEGNSIAIRLFMVIRNMLENKESTDNFFIFLLGSSKTLFYVILCFYHFLKLILKNENEIKCLFENQFCIITDDNLVFNECASHGKCLNNFTWEILLDSNTHMSIPLIHETPTKYHSLNNACNILDKKLKDVIPIFVYTTKQSHDAIRICQHIKQVNCMLKKDYIGIIASVTDDIKFSVEKLLREYEPLNSFLLKYEGFPSSVNDLVLRKSRIIGNQIISISNCLRDDNNKEKKCLAGKIVYCIPNEPGVLARIITQLTGYNNFGWDDYTSSYPSFFNNYVYTLRSDKLNINNTFVFRGDAFLSKLSPSCDCEFLDKSHVFDFYEVYGKKEFINEVEKKYKNKMNKNFYSSYNPRCPLSESHCKGHNIVRELGYASSRSFATVKILARYDDIPGAFGLVLSDFLMAGKRLQCELSEFNDLYPEIAYENCIVCHKPENILCRLYVQFKKTRDYIDDKSSKTSLKSSIDEMLKKRAIIGIKIKPSSHNYEWREYSERLYEYLNQWNSDFEYEIINNEIFLYNRNITTIKEFLEKFF